MLGNRLYYELKPYLPWRLRMSLRRMLARRKLRTCKDVWPIDETAARPPDGWPGWPDGKKFALVLTHDIEGPEGLAKCRQLMQLEMELGFRSSFNFIPEGDYIVPPELRAELAQNGFEVGVHDLHHDGKLYRSRRDFAEKAVWINRYLKDWGAVGFRSGFMFHNLDWLHDLEILYDTSTFDTDPFEPQPDGANTIFPFWVPNPKSETRDSKSEIRDPQSTIPSHSAPRSHVAPLSRARGSRGTLHAPSRPGYVELPYTLPQDSTLFLNLGEKTIDIWKQKLDWVAKHGGMALVNVHPDYLNFERGEPAPRTAAAELYVELLEYARERHGNTFWQPLAREVARFVATVQPRPVYRKHRRVCMLTYSYYLGDTRVTRYAEALAERGDHVDVVALRGPLELRLRETFGNIDLFRIQKREIKEKSKLSYLLPLLRFLAASSWRIARKHARQPYDLVHIHNVPDFLVFAAWWPKLNGTKVILDIHDIVPEFFGSKFAVPNKSLTIRLLKVMERASASFADHVILPNHLWLEKYTSRSAPPEKCSVMINHAERQIFFPRLRTRNDGKIIILFPGGLQWHQGLDIAIRAFTKVSANLPQAEFHIYGEGSMKDSLVALSNELGLDGKVRFFDMVPVRQIAELMANADLGVVPKRANSFGNEAYSTKIMEFMSLGVPVVVSNTKIDRYYFDDSIVQFFESGNPDALAEAMLDVLRDGESRRQMVARASEYAARNCWESHKADYLALVDSHCEHGNR
jgi:glycosyltransferase involved in cell wall biosynthesis